MITSCFSSVENLLNDFNASYGEILDLVVSNFMDMLSYLFSGIVQRL